VVDDWFGDLLREFYLKFGAAGEGPPAHTNVCALFEIGSNASEDLKTDVELLRSLCGNARLSSLVQDCDHLLDEIRHSSERALHNEIDTYLEDMAIEPAAVYHGVVWYAQAAIADPRDGDSTRRFYQRDVEYDLL
jgi:hypothetical protein